MSEPMPGSSPLARLHALAAGVAAEDIAFDQGFDLRTEAHAIGIPVFHQIVEQVKSAEDLNTPNFSYVE